MNILLSVRRFAAAVLVAPLCAVAALAGGGGGAAAAVVAPAVADSYQPIDVQGVTIANFGVVDGRMYRGAQPKGDEYRQLAALGVTAVVDLRLDARRAAREEAEAAGLEYINIPMDDTAEPTDENVLAFQKILESHSGRLFVHCAGGRHRTGAMIAVYRMTHNGWNVDQAYREMLNYDFYTRWGHGGYKTYVFDYYARMQSNPASVPVSCAVSPAVSLSIPAVK